MPATLDSKRALSDLIARLEKATGPDRKLDCAIYKFLGAKPPSKKHPLYWIAPGNTTQHYESLIRCYTASIDAALDLVPEGWSVDLVQHRGNIGNVARVYNDGLSDEPLFICHATKPLAIALCIAALKARATGAAP